MRKGIGDLPQHIKLKAMSDFEAGMRKSQIARELGISRMSVTRIVGVTRPKVHPYRRKRAIALYVRHKKSQVEIADILGVSTGFVCTSLSDIPKRPRPKKLKVISENKHKVLRRKPGPKPRSIEVEPEAAVYEMRPAIKDGTRPVVIKHGLVVHAKFSESEESVRARYRKKLGIQ